MLRVLPAIVLVCQLVACSANVWGEGDDDTITPVLDDDDDVIPWDDDDDDTYPPGVEHVPGAEQPEDPSNWIFNLHQIHQVDITLSAAAVSSLWADPYTYVEGDLVYDGVPMDQVGFRLKGHLGSYRDLDHKAGFKVDFNRYDPSQELSGLEQLNLNNMVQDYAFTHDLIASELYRAMGIPTPRWGYGWVTVNGADYGLYGVLEAYDDVFLDKNFEESDGNLYDGDYFHWDDGSITFLDFSSDVHHLFKLTEGVDVGLADIHTVTAAVEACAAGADWSSSIGAVVHMGHFVRYWATEIWVGQYDGYTYNHNNYRVYFDPADGLVKLMPWDHDWAFCDTTPITSPGGYLSYYCKADPACHDAFSDALDDVRYTADTSALDLTLEQAIDLINPYIDADPRKEISMDTVEEYQDHQRDWIHTRSDTLAATSGL